MKGKTKKGSKAYARSNHDEILERACRLLKRSGVDVLKKKYDPETEMRKNKIRLKGYCGEIDILALDEPVLMVVEVKSNGGATHHAAQQLRPRADWAIDNKETVEKYVLGGRSFEKVESIVCYEDIDPDNLYSPPYWLVLQHIDPKSSYWNNGGNGHVRCDRRMAREEKKKQYDKWKEQYNKWRQYDRDDKDQYDSFQSILGKYDRISEELPKITIEMKNREITGNHSF